MQMNFTCDFIILRRSKRFSRNLPNNVRGYWGEGVRVYGDWRGSIRISEIKDLKGDRATNEWACEIQTYNLNAGDEERCGGRFDTITSCHYTKRKTTTRRIIPKSCRRNDDILAAHTRLERHSSRTISSTKSIANLFVFEEDLVWKWITYSDTRSNT